MIVQVSVPTDLVRSDLDHCSVTVKSHGTFELPRELSREHHELNPIYRSRGKTRTHRHLLLKPHTIFETWHCKLQACRSRSFMQICSAKIQKFAPNARDLAPGLGPTAPSVAPLLMRSLLQLYSSTCCNYNEFWPRMRTRFQNMKPRSHQKRQHRSQSKHLCA